ncbi:DUF6434 domain-containing protein [Tateyamaria sp. Alg231-49]|uniref:DUF6434 domain-containing protein n=1 Tax=Tateyamaria sp. Alg231-49 TaxID=1922219 RepID=UPI000D56191B|nr:DUF6434 domain-containing protein [Tateyamaria sp. Alg231-49]
MAVDWRGGEIIRQTPLDSGYRDTQNVRRFLTTWFGGGGKFVRPFMSWITSGGPRTMGDVADEWLARP